MLHHALPLSPGDSSLPGDTFDFSSCWTQTAKTEQGGGRGRRAGWSTGPRLLELPTNERTARNAGLGRLGGRRALRSCCLGTFVLTLRGLERGMSAHAGLRMPCVSQCSGKWHNRVFTFSACPSPAQFQPAPALD